MNERIYRTPRTYGSPTGYDVELTHYPSLEARMAESIVKTMCRAAPYRDFTPQQLADRACEIAASMVNAADRRGWLLPVEDAPGMKKDYGEKRGSADPDGVAPHSTAHDADVSKT